jgi:hypothetical protein
MRGEDIVHALAAKKYDDQLNAAADVLLSDFRKGQLGLVGLEVPPQVYEAPRPEEEEEGGGAEEVSDEHISSDSDSGRGSSCDRNINISSTDNSDSKEKGGSVPRVTGEGTSSSSSNSNSSGSSDHKGPYDGW